MYSLFLYEPKAMFVTSSGTGENFFLPNKGKNECRKNKMQIVCCKTRLYALFQMSWRKIEKKL